MPKKKQFVRGWQEIRSDFQDMANMSCRPLVGKVPTNHVFDENQSVKWNREQVEAHNRKHDQEVKDLNTKKNKRRDELMEEICYKIVHELDFRINTDGAKKIFNRAYEQGHSNGIIEVFYHLEELVSLFYEVLVRGGC